MSGKQSRGSLKMAVALIALTALAVALLTAWGGAGTTAAQAEPTVLIRMGAAGAFLTGSNEMTLYIFDRDEANVSNCNDRCAETWPPLLLAEGDPVAPPDLSGTLSTFTRADGRRQVAYNERPLYFFAGDMQPGDTRGDGVGGVWRLARPESASVLMAAATPAPTEAPQATAPPPPPPAPTPTPTPMPPYEPPAGPIGPVEPPSYPY